MIIWLASYPKSGNTWLRFYIISLLMGKQTDLNLNHLKAIMNYFPPNNETNKNFYNHSRCFVFSIFSYTKQC